MLQYTAVPQEPSAHRGVQHAAPVGTWADEGADRGELSTTAWAVAHSASGTRSGNAACALWRVPLLFLEDSWCFLTWHTLTFLSLPNIEQSMLFQLTYFICCLRTEGTVY